ncbi:MAG: hypothetical protein ACT4O0_05695 [Pseudonocardia sp.]|jgi:hypothetical protein
MSKRRVTLNLDAEIVDALKAIGGESLSATVNEKLREAVEGELHRAALLRWLDQLDATFGAPTAEMYSQAEALLDELKRGHSVDHEVA